MLTKVVSEKIEFQDLGCQRKALHTLILDDLSSDREDIHIFIKHLYPKN